MQMKEVNKNLNPKFGREFQEIGHCGGQYSVDVKISPDGCRSIQFGFTHSRPTPASLFGIYVSPEGTLAGCIPFGGVRQSAEESPIEGKYFQILIASDSLGMFGHQCRKCGGYWRSKSAPARWKMICPYCGLWHDMLFFLTEGQMRYVKFCYNMIIKALNDEKESQIVINMDEVADAVSKDGDKPEFYYAEVTQQNLYECVACDDVNDILGKYGYCSSCGTFNGLQELKRDIAKVKERIDTGSEFSIYAKDAVSVFDSSARQIAKQLAARIPMTQRRRNGWERKLFHNLKVCADDLQSVFDIDIFKGLSQADRDFAILMFHRRHVYEHNGGEVDEKYIQDSGDTSVRLKQEIRESRETALRIATIVSQLGKNLLEGFHSIFPLQEAPIKIKQDRIERLKNFSR